MSQNPLTRNESSGGLESLNQFLCNKEFREQFTKMFFNKKLIETVTRKMITEESQDCDANRSPPPTWDESDESDENPRSNALSNEMINSIKNSPAFHELRNLFVDEPQTSAESSWPPQLLSDEPQTSTESSCPPRSGLGLLSDESSTPEESSCPPQSLLDELSAPERYSYTDQLMKGVLTPKLLGPLQKFAANPNKMVEFCTLGLKLTNKLSENGKLEQFIDCVKGNNNDETNNDQTNNNQTNNDERFFSIFKRLDTMMDVLASTEFEEVSELLLAGVDRETIKRNKKTQWTFIREKLDCTGTNDENKVFLIYTSEKMAQEVAELTPIAKQYKNATTEDEKREIRQAFTLKLAMIQMNEACNKNTDDTEVSGAAAATAKV